MSGSLSKSEMSRVPIPPQRNLSLTEELEKLEQSITLTLQEIDSNFSRAHRIVTTSILPLVEQYAEHSKDVWEGAKFWKQFFEASANVSLSGYEEQPNEGKEQEQTVSEEFTDTTYTTLDGTASYETPSSEHLDIDRRGEDLDLSSLSLSPSHSTPRPPTRQRERGEDDSTTSSIPYLPLRETPGQRGEKKNKISRIATPTTPGRPLGGPRGPVEDYLETPLRSPLIPPEFHGKPSTARKDHRKPTDPVLHHILDKTYRVQATPLAKGFGRSKVYITTPKAQSSSKYMFNDSPVSSPEMEAPKLHEEVFASPIKLGGLGMDRKRRLSSKSRVDPIPGVSVLTPGKKSIGNLAMWDSDDDLDGPKSEELDASPPKTMQFHIPQSRLMRTPAKEASKRIVSDLLATASGGRDITDEYEDVEDIDHSPTVIERTRYLDEETF